jgi:ATP-dependent exoDNAse (exonuclease V) beta subunit
MVSEEPIQPYFAYGKLVHKIAEVYVQEQGKKAIETIASECLKGNIEVDQGKPAPILTAEYKKKLPQHLKNIKKINDEIGYDGELEWLFKYDMQPPDNHMITGVIDRLIIRGDKYFILDYKTTKKGKWRKNAGDIGKDLQLRCYARVVNKHYGAKPENIRAALYYVDGVGGELVSTRFTEESIMTAEEELHKSYKHIISTNPNDTYGRVGDQCRRCDWRKICHAFKTT